MGRGIKNIKNIRDDKFRQQKCIVEFDKITDEQIKHYLKSILELNITSKDNFSSELYDIIEFKFNNTVLGKFIKSNKKNLGILSNNLNNLNVDIFGQKYRELYYINFSWNDILIYSFVLKSILLYATSHKNFIDYYPIILKKIICMMGFEVTSLKFCCIYSIFSNI